MLSGSCPGMAGGRTWPWGRRIVDQRTIRSRLIAILTAPDLQLVEGVGPIHRDIGGLQPVPITSRSFEEGSDTTLMNAPAVCRPDHITPFLRRKRNGGSWPNWNVILSR